MESEHLEQWSVTANHIWQHKPYLALPLPIITYCYEHVIKNLTCNYFSLFIPCAARQDPVLQSEHVDTEDQSLNQNTSAAVPRTPWGSQRGVLSASSSEELFPRELLPEPNSVRNVEQRRSCAVHGKELRCACRSVYQCCPVHTQSELYCHLNNIQAHSETKQWSCNIQEIQVINSQDSGRCRSWLRLKLKTWIESLNLCLPLAFMSLCHIIFVAVTETLQPNVSCLVSLILTVFCVLL